MPPNLKEAFRLSIMVVFFLGLDESEVKIHIVRSSEYIIRISLILVGPNVVKQKSFIYKIKKTRM